MTAENFFLNCIRMSQCDYQPLHPSSTRVVASFQVVPGSFSMKGLHPCEESSGHCHLTAFLVGLGLVAGGALVGYYVGVQLTKKKARVNNLVKLSTDKVVDSVDVEDIGDKKVFCRCWKSEKFPYCDGTHSKHNACSGDNVGPLVIKKKESS